MNSDSEELQYLRSLTILFVEDEPEVRAQTAEFLQRRCKKVLLARDGEEGLNVFHSDRPDIVVSDLLMPRMDGLGMSAEIRKANRKVPIVIVTAFDNTEFLIRSIEVGVDRYVMKPVRPERLHRALLDCAHLVEAERELQNRSRAEAKLAELRHSHAMSILAGGLLHDYNNLLQSVSFSISKAKLVSLTDPAVQQQLVSAEKSMEQVQQLSSKLMRILNSQALKVNRVSVSGLLASGISRAVSERQCAYEICLENPLLMVPCDESIMEQTVEAIARNAFEAMDHSGRLIISANEEELVADESHPLSSGKYLHIAFMDSGTGIAPEFLPYVFEPYASTKPRGSRKGQGLSLALALASAKLHGGTITVESTPGSGSTFHLYVPAVR